MIAAKDNKRAVIHMPIDLLHAPVSPLPEEEREPKKWCKRKFNLKERSSAVL